MMTTDRMIVPDFNTAGELSSLRFGGVEFAAQDGGTALFELRLRDIIGNPLLLGGGDFRTVRREEADGRTVLHFSECGPLPGTRVTATATVSGAEIRWRIEAEPGSVDFRVEWIEFPRLRLRRFPDGKFLLPLAEGTLVSDLAEREKNADFRCEPAEYPMTGVGGFYPGPAAMQFEAYYTGAAGLCFRCCDPGHSPKSIDAMPDGERGVRPLLRHFTGGEPAVGYDTAITGFHGDWQDAAEIYRDWMERNDPVLPPKLATRMPPWLADSPVLLIYPVKGDGLDLGGLTPNEYYPYCKALPVAAGYRKRWNSRIMALLMHWEGTAPWAPPCVWPPSGGEALLKEFIDAMHRDGDLVGLYGSGIGWTQKSMIDPAYDRTRQFEEERIDREICTGPRGEAFSRVCNGHRGQRLGYDLCPDREFTAKTVEHEISAAARLGVDYLQYFDQNQGCAAPLCYSKRHGHPPLPGAWHTAAMRKLLAGAEKAAGHTVLGCENAAAEPYLEVCRLNDLRSHLAWGASGEPVPLYSYLFHEYTAGFSGNGVCLSNWVDVGRTPFFLQWTLAWNFAFGNVLSVVLKDGGNIHWHWALPWSVKPPEQEPLNELIANLTVWRRGRAAEYLVAGRMEKAPQTACGSRTVFLRKHAPAQTAAVIASAWSRNGKHAVLLVNYGDRPEPCRVDFDGVKSGTVFTRSEEDRFESASPLLTVPPLDALLLEFDSRPADAAAAGQ